MGTSDGGPQMGEFIFFPEALNVHHYPPTHTHTHASPARSIGGNRASINRQRISDFDYDLYQLEHSETNSSRPRRANGDLEGHG